MRREMKEKLKKRRAASKVIIIPGKRKKNIEESEFEKKKHADAIAFLKKHGLPKSFNRQIKWDD
jgi:hypothetical protein